MTKDASKQIELPRVLKDAITLKHLWWKRAGFKSDPYINGYPLELLELYRGEKVVIRVKGEKLFQFSVPRKKEIKIPEGYEATGFWTKDTTIDILVYRVQCLRKKLKAVRASRERLLDKIDNLLAELQYFSDEQSDKERECIKNEQPVEWKDRKPLFTKITDYHKGNELVEDESLDIESKKKSTVKAGTTQAVKDKIAKTFIFTDCTVPPSIKSMIKMRLDMIGDASASDFKKSIEGIAKCLGLKVIQQKYSVYFTLGAVCNEPTTKLLCTVGGEEPLKVNVMKSKSIMLLIDRNIEAKLVTDTIQKNLSAFYSSKKTINQRTVYNFLKSILPNYSIRVKGRGVSFHCDMLFDVAIRGEPAKNFFGNQQYKFEL